MRFTAVSLLTVGVISLACAAQKPATPPLEFAREYSRQLVSLEEVRARGEADLRVTDDDNGKLSSGIHFSTLMQLELRQSGWADSVNKGTARGHRSYDLR